MDIRRIRLLGKRHYYDADLPPEERYYAPSNSTILSLVPSPELDEWRETVGEEKARQITMAAANRGTVMHRMNEEYLKAGHDLSVAQDTLHNDEELVNFTDKERKIGKSLFYKLYRLGWMDEIEEVIASELMMVVPLAGGYGGTADLVARFDDGIIRLVDFKSAKRPKDKVQKYLLQAAGYWMMLHHIGDHKPKEAQIWVIPETRHAQRFIFTKEKLKEAGRVFLKLCKKYHERHDEEIQAELARKELDNDS